MKIEKCYSENGNCPCCDCGIKCVPCADRYFDTEQLCTLAKAYCEGLNGNKAGEQNERT